jgi:hypothetical protein
MGKEDPQGMEGSVSAKGLEGLSTLGDRLKVSSQEGPLQEDLRLEQVGSLDTLTLCLEKTISALFSHPAVDAEAEAGATEAAVQVSVRDLEEEMIWKTSLRGREICRGSKNP